MILYSSYSSFDTMRVRLSKKDLDNLFDQLRNYGQKELALTQGVSLRTITDWRRGISTMPVEAFTNFLKLSDIKEGDLSPKLLPDFWNAKTAAREGALVRTRLYGNFGTPEGRRKGGLASLATHYKNKSNFKTLKKIRTPPDSTKLAEFLGILIGDGHLSKYQVSISTNAVTDKEHALFSSQLIANLFGTNTTVRNKKGENTITVVASSTTLVDFLNTRGMPIGNKIKTQLRIPDWILKNNDYQKAFIRGLFDTDGCIYLDTHKIKGKIYKNMGWTITSYADNLISGVINLMGGMGFSPTYRSTQKSVYLRRRKEIVRYFTEIGTSNPKHYARYQKFSGGVPKRS